MKGKVSSVMSVKDILRKLGEKSAVTSVDARSRPTLVFQPKPPAKIQAMINKTDK